MSHTTKRKTAIKDPEVLKKAIARTPGATYIGLGRSNRYDGQSTQGHQVKLDDWRYPITFDLNTGEAAYDNYNGAWGKEEQLDKLSQGYAVEAAKMKAAEEHREIEEYSLPDGGIKLVISLGSGGYSTGATATGGWDV